MSVDDAILEFIAAMEQVFGKPRIFSMRGPIPWKRARYDEELLRDIVKNIVDRRLPSSSDGHEKFDSNPELCRT
jgi:hypothetical protein